MAKLHFSLVAPEREVFSGEVDQVDAPGVEGDFGVLAGHAPFMTVIRSGAANIVGTVVGVAIIGVMSNGLNILGVNAYVQQVVTGLIIIAAVTLSSFKSRER